MQIEKRLVSIIFLSAAFILFSGSIHIYAQDKKEDSKNSIPEGMEIKKVGDLNILIPQGAKLSKKGDVVIVESPNEYFARKLLGIEERFKKIEASQEEIKSELKLLKETLNNTQKKNISPEQKQQ